MQRNTLRKLHGILAMIAILCIVSFWTSTVISELFLSHEAVINVKQAILQAFWLFIPCIALIGMTGMKMGGKSKHELIVKKRNRMPIIAGIGLVILIPSAFFLASKATAEEFDGVFYTVQGLELLAGAINLTLMGKSMKEGLAIRKPKV